MLNIKIGTNRFFKISALLVLIICIFFASGFVLCNTYFGWKIQQSAYRLSDDFSGCRETNNSSPTTYVENSILRYNSSSRGMELPPFRNYHGIQFYEEHGIEYVRTIYDYASLIIYGFNVADIKCWARHGDPMAIMWLYEQDYSLDGSGLTIINPDKYKDMPYKDVPFEEITKLLNKITTNSFNIYNNSGNFSVCNDALEKGIITCRQNFPEAYFVKALYTCHYLKDEKRALELMKTAYRYGDFQSKFLIDSWYTEGSAELCSKGEKLIWAI